MGKKKHKNRHKASAPDQSLLVRDLREAIADQRGRRAHALAKQLEKAGDQGDHDELLAKAYAVRAEEMISDGHCTEAAEMLDALVERKPNSAACLDDRLTVNVDCFRRRPRLLQHWGDSSWSDRLTAAISGGLLNLEWLRDAPGLPADHDLRRQACVLLQLWQAIEDGAAVKALDDWQAISRRSPLVYWRLFIQALGAYYEHDDDQVEANLRRIPDESAVKPLADGLRRLLQEQAPAGEAGAAIWSRTRGQSLSSELEYCEQLVDRNAKGALMAVKALAHKLTASGRHQLAADILAAAYYRLDGIEDKLGDLMYQETLSASDAFLAGRLCMLFDDDKEYFIKKVVESKLTLVPKEAALLWLIVAQEAQENDGFLSHWDERLSESPAAGPEARWKEVDRYFRLSIACAPRTDTFQAWCHAAQESQMDDSYILKLWEDALPDDPKLWHAKRRILYRKGSFVEARQTLDRIIELEGSTPALQELRVWDLLEEAKQHLHRGNFPRMEETLSAIVPLRTDQALARDILLWVGAGSDRSAKRARGQVLEAYEEPIMVLASACFVDPSFSLSQLPAGVKRQFDDSVMVLKSFRSVCELPERCTWYSAETISTQKLMDAFRDKTVDRNELLRTLDSLARHSSTFADVFSIEAAQAMAVNGLRRKQEPKALFLAWFSLLYVAELADLPPDPEYAEELLGAAAWLARQEKQDEEAVAELAMQRGQLADPRERIMDYSRKEVNQLLRDACEGPSSWIRRSSIRNHGDYDDMGFGDEYLDSEAIGGIIVYMRQMKAQMPPDEWDRFFEKICAEPKFPKELKATLKALLEMPPDYLQEFLDGASLPDFSRPPRDDPWG